MLEEYFKKKDGMAFRFYFSSINELVNTQTLTTLTFKYKFPKDFQPALKEIWDKVREIRNNET